MLAPEQNTRSLALVSTTVRTAGCSKRMRCTRVVQLDVDAEVVRVELELVAGADAAVLADVHRERGDRRRRPRAASGDSATGRCGSRRARSACGVMGHRALHFSCTMVRTCIILHARHSQPASIGACRRTATASVRRSRVAQRRRSSRSSGLPRGVDTRRPPSRRTALRPARMRRRSSIASPLPAIGR